MLIAITPPSLSPELIEGYIRLLRLGLHSLHLRLVGASRREYEELILAFPPELRERLVLTEHYELIATSGVGGIHLSRKQVERWDEIAGLIDEDTRISVSVHSLEEVRALPFSPSYALLSPIYESRSKLGYRPTKDWLSLIREGGESLLRSLPCPLVALGGITPERQAECLRAGFAAVATLAYLSEEPREMVARFLSFDRPSVLVVGGHDPSNGAGITADVLMLERLGVRALSLVVCLTSQHEESFDRLYPIDRDTLLSSLDKLLEKHRPSICKIGLVPSLEEGLWLVKLLRERGISYIIWDPILRASASRDEEGRIWQRGEVLEMLRLVDLVTPNADEVLALCMSEQVDEHQLRELAREQEVAILLKGGHRQPPSGIEEHLCSDTLIEPSGSVLRLQGSRGGSDKHGTGCKLSSAVAARLAQLYPLSKACREAQREVDAYRRSHASLYGYHLGLGEEKRARELSPYPLMYITSGQTASEVVREVESVLEGGIRWIQLRLKDRPSDERLSLALELKALMRAYPDSRLIINDDVAVALASDADGVHLGLSDGSPIEARRRLGWGKIIGATCNTPDDLRQRALEGVDYIGVGPYRHTTTKTNLAPLLGAEGLVKLVRYNRSLAQPIPMYAIGGIVDEDFALLARLGLDGVALSGAIGRSNNIRERSRAVVAELRQHFGQKSRQELHQ